MRTKLVLFIGVVGMVGILSAAKPGKDDKCKKLEKMLMVMKDSLSLTANQEIQINRINDTACAHFQVAKLNAKGDKEAMKASMKKIRLESKEGYKKVLTETQLKKWKQMHQNHAKKHEFDPEKRANKLAEKMKVELSLDAEQTEKVKAANLELIKGRMELKTMKDGNSDSTELRSKAKQLHKSYDEKIKVILTHEQYSKFKELKKEGKEKIKAKR